MMEMGIAWIIILAIILTFSITIMVSKFKKDNQ